MKTFVLKRIEEAFDWLQKEFEDIEVQQSLDDLNSKQNAINSVIAWAYEQMAVAKMNLNEAKQKAYLELNSKPASMRPLYSPSIAKDFINSSCSKENYAFDLTERLCRACVHISDNIRTSISAMKQLLIMENYSNSQS